MGAGLGTGFAGMSAAAVITPMLVTFLKMESYEAVGIALASDVLASGISAYEYGKHKNLDIKNGSIMMISVLIFTVLGSFASNNVANGTMGTMSVIITMLLGIRFIIKPVMTTKDAMAGISSKKTPYPIRSMRYIHRLYLRFCRSRRRNDDAHRIDEYSRIRIKNRCRHKCFHYDIYGVYRFGQPFLHRWQTQFFHFDLMHCLHVIVGKNRRKDRKQSKTENTESLNRNDFDRFGYRGTWLQSLFLKQRPLWN